MSIRAILRVYALTVLRSCKQLRSFAFTFWRSFLTRKFLSIFPVGADGEPSANKTVKTIFFDFVAHFFTSFSWGSGNTKRFVMQLCSGVQIGTEGFSLQLSRGVRG